jgi:hypothetical protein
MTLVLNGTTGVSAVDGSASTPAIQGNDTNTGIFFPAADTVAIATNGSERMRVTSGGDIGIGTSSPAGRLSVQGSASASAVNIDLANNAAQAVGDAVTIRLLTSSAFVAAPTAAPYISAIQTNASTSNTDIAFGTFNGTSLGERARITSGGDLLVGTTSSSGRLTVSGGVTSVGTGGSNDNSLAFEVVSSGNTQPFRVYTSANGSANAAAAAVRIQTHGTTGRSINATGTINASGADYAEYMAKAGDFTIAKGDVVGINAQGKLTNIFADAVSFAVKSTNPSYVGNDDWGVGFEEDPEGLEAARQAVDRIAFAGQVPVNVLGAAPGQYIVPTDDNGTIKGIAVSSPTFEQYQLAVGKVIAIEADGRARIIVKVA